MWESDVGHGEMSEGGEERSEGGGSGVGMRSKGRIQQGQVREGCRTARMVQSLSVSSQVRDMKVEQRERTALANKLLWPEVIDTDHLESLDARASFKGPLHAMTESPAGKHLALDLESPDREREFPTARVTPSILDDAQEAVETDERGESHSLIQQWLCDRRAELVYAREGGERAQGRRAPDSMSEDDEDEFGRESREASGIEVISVHLGESHAHARGKSALWSLCRVESPPSGGSAAVPREIGWRLAVIRVCTH